MFCRKCGRELPDNAAFCNKCGAETGIQSSIPQPPAPDTMTVARPIHGAIPGSLAVLAAVMLFIAPAVRFNIYFANQELSLLDLATQYSELSKYLGSSSEDVAGVIFAIVGIAIAAVLVSAFGIFRCFNGGKTNGALWFIPGAAVAFAAYLLYISGESYGIVSPSTWLWLTAVVGAAAAVIEIVREQGIAS